MAANQGPFNNYRFIVQINGVNVGFCEVTGLETESKPIEYREGGDHIVRKLIGIPRYGNITLKRGVTVNNDLQSWHHTILNGQNDRRNCTISLLDEEGGPAVTWQLYNAWPTKWEGPDLNAKGNDVAIETLVLCVDRIERE
jgi:phage tail-like protein